MAEAPSGYYIPAEPNDPVDPNDPNFVRGVPGDVTARFVYDGLGRLIRIKTHLETDEPRELEIYYDGVRRIKERYYEDPVAGFEPLGAGLFAMMMSMELLDPGELLGTWEETDYVWGPDYVDELAYLINPSGAEIYAVQDANFNVVGWAKQTGVAVANFVRGPYGDLRVAEYKNPASPPRYALDHQGLFFVRFDGEAGDAPFEPGAKGLYYNRNRWYSPELGRFITQDVNAVAMPILTALAYNGEALDTLLGGFDGGALYGDGMNLYLYTGANPVSDSDPSGLFFGGLAGLMGGSFIGNDLNYETADQGLSFLNALQGFVDLVSVRNLELSEFADMSASGNIDSALHIMQGAQTARRVLLAAGVLCAGAELSKAAFSASWKMIKSGSRVIAKGRNIRDICRLMRKYGGSAGDWSKKSSAILRDPSGRRFEWHWYEKAGQVIEKKKIWL